MDDSQFDLPPSLFVGIITGLVGAAAAVVSLLVYFKLFQPETYISQRWLIFVFLGTVIGFFLRLERPPVEEASDSSGTLAHDRNCFQAHHPISTSALPPRVGAQRIESGTKS
jgi:H+/Cl- antiporter ClcA